MTQDEQPQVGEKIIERPIVDEMKVSYLDYSMSVIIGRALPEVRDGLKPVHRRILYSMGKAGLTSSKPFRKSAFVVGRVLAELHPHGDQAVYDSIVRMAQDFSLRYPLIQGQGNFGSVDGDRQAAMRYCVTGNSLIITNRGLQRIDEISKKENISISVLSKDKKVNIASKWFDSGEHKTLKITSHKGYELTGSYNHPVLTLSKQANGRPHFEWKLLDKIQQGDYLVIDRREDDFWTKKKLDIRKCEGSKGKERQLPKYLDEDLAFILGALIAEGSITENKVEFCNSDRQWIAQFQEKWDNLFPDSKLHMFERNPSSYGKKTYVRLECHCRRTVEFLKNLGIEGKSKDKEFPKPILVSPKGVVKSFLQAYFEGDGTVTFSKKMFELGCCSSSEQLLKTIQVVLLRFGIDSTRRYDKYRKVHKLYLRGKRNTLRFYKEIGFVSDRKKQKLEFMLHEYKKEGSLTDFVPFISDYIRSRTNSPLAHNYNFDRYHNMNMNYRQICLQMHEEGLDDVSQMFEYLLTYTYLFEEVEKVEQAGIQKVYSLRVDSDCHTFISNGFISHNTECRLTKIAEQILEDIEKETVDFEPNFDGSSKEPKVLPGKVPNLLINGSSGIAVGMATNMPPHNITEVSKAIIHVIDNADCSVQELMQLLPGPDFPTGALICGQNGIINAYSTGRGKVTVRSKSHIEEKKDSRQAIIIDEIPYMVNKAETIKQIADLVRDKVITGISDLRDESDRQGTRVVIELKRDANPDVLLNQLFKHSRLQVTFGINMLAIINNQPKILPLKHVLLHYVNHRVEVITRRTTYDLNKAKDRAHILEGLMIALQNIDPIVAFIKSSKNVEEAKSGLINKYTLSEKQAVAILEMRLQRLTALEQDKIKTELEELKKTIIDLQAILDSKQKILDIIKEELEFIIEKFGDERRTQIIPIETTDLNMEDLIEEDEMAITVTHNNYIKRIPLDTYKIQKRGGKGVIGTGTTEEDFVEDVFVANTHSYLLFFTTKGRVHWQKVYEIPEGSRTAKGKAIVNLLNLQDGEEISAYIPVKTFNPDAFIVMATKKGIIKKSQLSLFSKPRSGGIIALDIRDGDELIGVRLTDGKRKIFMATKNGQAVRFDEENVRPMGRGAAGVRGIKLKGNDEVIGLLATKEEDSIFTVTQNGYGKRTQVSEYRLTNRGGSGVTNIICSDRNGPVVAAAILNEGDEVLLISQKGIIIRTRAADISVIGRATQGVRVMRLKDEDRTVGIAKIPKETLDADTNSSE